MKLMLVGESLSKDDVEEGRPFSGALGHILKGMLSLIGLAPSDLHLTNVFNRYAHNQESLCGTKAEGIPTLPALIRGKYVRAEFGTELDRLYAEIKREEPNAIIAMGAAATWALLHAPKIRAIRGSTTGTPEAVSQLLGRTYKVIPTYAVSSVARDWTMRPIVINDLNKAKRESTFPEVNRPERHIWIEPTLADLQLYEDEYVKEAEILSVDIETKGDQITCIGFAPSTSSAIVIPFYAEGAPNNNYWSDSLSELTAWEYVRRWCKKPAVFQNGLYDIQFLWRRYGIMVPQAKEDTMLMHHAFQLEMEKGLGFLASIYTDEASWKFMRKTDTIKKGE